MLRRTKTLVALALILSLMFAGAARSVLAQDAGNQSEPATPVAETVHEGTRDDPIPRGQSAEIGDWEVEIVGWKRNAVEEILAENMFNDPPEDGMTFSLVTIRLTYNGDETGKPGDLRVRAVGKSNIGYDQGDCGVIPNVYYDVAEIFPGGKVTVNWCFAVSNDDARTLLVYIQDAWDFDGKPIFFDPVKRDD